MRSTSRRNTRRRRALRAARRLVPAATALWLLIATVPHAGDRPVLVTVDDLPMSPGLHPDLAEREAITRDLLAVLDRHGIRAVGMVTWGNVIDRADQRLLDLWLEAGHELGNHSHRHLSYTSTTIDAYIEDVEHARRALTAFLEPRDRALRFFRYPMLREGDTREKLDAMRSYLERSGQRNLPVTLDNQDWSFERPWVEAARRGDREAMRRIGDAYQESLHLSVRHHERTGDRLEDRILPQILLLHATAIGAAQWGPLFDWLESTGHRFAGADEILADPIFAVKPAYVGTHGPGLWDRHLAVRRLDEARRQVTALLADQQRAWSRGDLEAFCSAYADDALFLSPSGVTRGRQAVLDRYRRRYPDARAMGTLSLEVLDIHLAEGTEVSMLGDARPSRIHGATVTARWHLDRPGMDAASGTTLIVLEPGPDGWHIVRDASM